MSHTAGQFRCFSHEHLILIAPVDDDFRFCIFKLTSQLVP
jgi:hypothetical protein